MRRGYAVGSGRFGATLGRVDFPDEPPTRPDISGAAARESIRRQLDLLSTTDMRALSRLVDCWAYAGPDERILIQELARALAKLRRVRA